MWVDNLLTIDTKVRDVSEKTEKLVLLDTQKYAQFKADAKKMHNSKQTRKRCRNLFENTMRYIVGCALNFHK